MAVVNWLAAIAVGTQADSTTVNPTIAALSGALTSADGIVLGDRASGDGDSGITIPNLVREFREKPDEPGSFTKLANTFLKTNVDGLGIAFELKGNGAASTPAAGEAKPLPGIDSLLLMAGLSGANGTAPEYEYIPALGTTFGTIKLWIADLSFVFGGCVVETLELGKTPGNVTIAIARIRVGFLDSAADGVTGVTYDYTTQSTLSAPTIQSAAFTWGQLRGFQELSVPIENTIETFGDSNEATGERLSQTERIIRVNGPLYLDDADSDFEYQESIKAVAPTADATWRIGDAAAPTDTLNAFNIEANNLQVTDVKYDKVGDLVVANIQSHCTGASGGGGGDEFKLTFD